MTDYADLLKRAEDPTGESFSWTPIVRSLAAALREAIAERDAAVAFGQSAVRDVQRLTTELDAERVKVSELELQLAFANITLGGLP